MLNRLSFSSSFIERKVPQKQFVAGPSVLRKDLFARFCGLENAYPDFVRVPEAQRNNPKVLALIKAIVDTWDKIPPSVQHVFKQQEILVGTALRASDLQEIKGFETAGDPRYYPFRPDAPRCLGIINPESCQLNLRIVMPVESSVLGKVESIPQEAIPYIFAEEIGHACDAILRSHSRRIESPLDLTLCSFSSEFMDLWRQDCLESWEKTSLFEKLLLQDAFEKPNEAFAQAFVHFLLPLKKYDSAVYREFDHALQQHIEKTEPSGGLLLTNLKPETYISVHQWFPRVSQYIASQIVPQLEEMSALK